MDAHRDEPSMRRIVVFDRISADGYICRPNGSMDWVVPEPEIDQEAMSGPGEFDTILFGRVTYEMFASFWPTVTDSSATDDPHAERPISKDMRAMARMLNASNKLVFSQTMKTATWANSRILPRFDAREIAAMKRGPGKDIITFGSASIVTQL